MYEFDVVTKHWHFLLEGLWVTVQISVYAILLSVVLGVAVGLARTYGGRVVSGILSLYVDVFRSIPLLVVLIWIYFALPVVIPAWTFLPFRAAVIGLALYEAAYISEAVRAGLTSVRSGQLRAALAIGMYKRQAIARIILPQAIIRMLPAIGTQVVTTVKDSAIASVLAVPELVTQSQTLSAQTFKPFPIYTADMLIFFALAFPVGRAIDRVYRRLAPLGSS